MRLTQETPDTPKPRSPRLRQSVSTALCLSVALGPSLARAELQIVTQQNGPPALPVPTFQETGLPNFTMPVGTSSLVPPPTGGTGGPGTGSGGSFGGTQVDGTLASRSWGPLAAQNATSLGVNPTAIAATCYLESGCMNLPGTGGPNNTVSGAFQMTNDTYLADIQRALAQNPSLAGTIDTSLTGKLDPANQAIAAAQDLKNAVSSLQAAGISNPTVLDTRGYFNFGARYGAPLAQASPDQLMSAVMPSYSASDLSKNGISSTTTVGQWRDSVAAKLGTAANQSVML